MMTERALGETFSLCHGMAHLFGGYLNDRGQDEEAQRVTISGLWFLFLSRTECGLM